MSHCFSCQARTDNGLALCDMCRRFATDNLPVLQVYIRNLARFRKPPRPNGSLGVAGQWLIKRGETEVDKVAKALEAAYNDLDRLVEMLKNDRGVEPPQADSDAETAIAYCELLEKHVASIATCEWAGEFIRDIERHLHRLAEYTIQVVPGWYAGECQQVTGRDMEGNTYRCGTPLFVIPGATWLTCQGCGTSSHASDHIDTILEEASDWVAPPMRLAEALVSLIATEQSVPRLHKRISKWGETRKRKRKVDGEEVEIVTPPKIAAVRRTDSEGDPIGPKRFRLGDVLELLLAEGATRTDDDTAPKTSRCA